MTEKHDSGTLRQQRQAQKEFLELKKMQHGEIDAGPKPSDVAIAPKTLREKIDNLWFHYKSFIIGGLFLAIALTVLITQCATKTEYDLKVIAYCYDPIGDDDCEAIGDYFEKYCEDTTGDGEINIMVVNCSYSKERSDRQYIYSMNTKAQVLLSSDATALLFITDDESYEHISSVATNGKLFEGEPLALDDEFYSSVDTDDYYELPKGLQLSCRIIEGTVIENEKNIDKYYNQAQNILSALSK